MAARNALYDRGLLRARRLNGAVVSVGNLSAGGAGKTPFVMLLGDLRVGLDQRQQLVFPLIELTRVALQQQAFLGAAAQRLDVLTQTRLIELDVLALRPNLGHPELEAREHGFGFDDRRHHLLKGRRWLQAAFSASLHLSRTAKMRKEIGRPRTSSIAGP